MTIRAQAQGYGQAVEVGIGVVVLLIPSLILNVPLIVTCVVFRRRFRHRQLSALLACSIAAAGGLILWYYLDSPGIPRSRTLVFTYLPTLVGLAIPGWFLGRWIGWESVMSEQERDRMRPLTR